MRTFSANQQTQDERWGRIKGERRKDNGEARSTPGAPPSPGDPGTDRQPDRTIVERKAGFDDSFTLFIVFTSSKPHFSSLFLVLFLVSLSARIFLTLGLHVGTLLGSLFEPCHPYYLIFRGPIWSRFWDPFLNDFGSKNGPQKVF